MFVKFPIPEKFAGSGDEEVHAYLTDLARNMTFLMKSIELGKKEFGLPEKEKRVATHFIKMQIGAECNLDF